MIKYIFSLAVVAVFSGGAAAQNRSLSEADILRAVEQHSPALQSAQATAQAGRLEARTGNTLPDPELGYTHQWGSSGASGQDEFTASQGFDFPTAYLQRGKAAKAKTEAADAAYRELRMGILLQARLAVQEIVYLKKRMATDSLRLADALFAQGIAQKQAETGDITSIEENRIEFQTLSARNNLVRTRMSLETALATLSSMAGTPLSEDTEIVPMPLPALPELDETLNKAYAADPGLSGAKATEKASLMERKLAASLALPKFSAGYKYSSSDGFKFNGVTVGMSLPIFESRNTVKLARARLAEAEAISHALQTTLTTEVNTKYSQAKRLAAMYDFYRESGNGAAKSALLKKALDAGSMTILEYFTELDPVYRNMDEFNELSYNYNTLVIELGKYSL